MVCIPCIVIPVLLWVYKRFLEPFIYPFISPFISRFWRSAVKEPPQKPSADECNGAANGSTAHGPKTVADKKAD
ncbi:UPF0729 protein C18orf32 homolog [Rhinichthys klamathensis goyatoka]|uniref:UPF0729 protein C18orf32 homolog n=1 Tax=Rhinichthys klamathensis goyatoka TaxID=3034132 RepID=UPI0024B5CD74|nr:UPF0729 protein C18orf32 homolog [Rhinichthys klamathensis goyatoka]